MIRLFDANETNFNHMGCVLKDTISAEITENKTSLYLNLTYPLLDEQGYSKKLVKGNIIKTNFYDNRGDQLFKIRKTNKNSKDNTIQVYAECIAMSDLSTNYITGIKITDCTRKQAIQQILNARVEKKRNYTVGNLDTNSNTSINLGIDDDTGNIINYIDVSYVNPLEAILGDENSVLKAYGGEIIFNNFVIDMVDKRNSDKTVTIKSGRNLEQLEEEIDDTNENFATALDMESSDGLFLPNHEIIYSPLKNNYDRIHFRHYKCDDIKAINNTQEAINLVYNQLREKANQLFNEDDVDKLGKNYTINFIELANTEEYKNYASLQEYSVGTIVKTIYEKLGLSVTSRIIEVKYNVLTDKIIEVSVGQDTTKNIVTTINNNTYNITNVSNTVVQNYEKMQRYKSELIQSDNEIKASVEDLDRNTKAELKVQSDAIIATVNGIGKNTSVVQDLNGITSEVVRGAFGTTLEQSSKEIAVAWNGYSQYAKLTKKGLTLGDTDTGTYSKIGTDGILELVADNGGKPYKYSCINITASHIVTIDTKAGQGFFMKMFNLAMPDIVWEIAKDRSGIFCEVFVNDFYTSNIKGYNTDNDTLITNSCTAMVIDYGANNNCGGSVRGVVNYSGYNLTTEEFVGLFAKVKITILYIL